MALAANSGQLRLARIANRVSSRLVLKYRFRFSVAGCYPRDRWDILMDTVKWSNRTLQAGCYERAWGGVPAPVTIGYFHKVASHSVLNKGTPKAKPVAELARTQPMKHRELANIRYNQGG